MCRASDVIKLKFMTKISVYYINNRSRQLGILDVGPQT
jgi:hypothetical protein